ncbi:hypothetical protein CPC08DRAFT_672311 [Agrocybe pediades]|nr:hypothetical protein CPC08DRAFT_672311 [Agrocybe pediades]
MGYIVRRSFRMGTIAAAVSSAASASLATAIQSLVDELGNPTHASSPSEPGRLLDTENAVLLKKVMYRKFITLATWAVLVYEYVVTFRSEVGYVWRRPRLNVVLGVYLISKYVGILAQSVNVYLVFKPLAKLGVQEQTCQRWYLFQIVTTAILLAALDFILMLRIYALYRKDTKVGAFLAFLFFSMIPVHAYAGPKCAYGVPYDSICEAKDMHVGALYFGVAVWIIHAALAVLTAAKWNLAALGAPIARLVTRDGAWVISILCLFLAVTIPHGFTVKRERPDLAFGWPITLLSIACCRIIMNMQKLDPTVDGASELSSGLQEEIELVHSTIRNVE